MLFTRRWVGRCFVGVLLGWFGCAALSAQDGKVPDLIGKMSSDLVPVPEDPKEGSLPPDFCLVLLDEDFKDLGDPELRKGPIIWQHPTKDDQPRPDRLILVVVDTTNATSLTPVTTTLSTGLTLRQSFILEPRLKSDGRFRRGDSGVPFPEIVPSAHWDWVVRGIYVKPEGFIASPSATIGVVALPSGYGYPTMRAQPQVVNTYEISDLVIVVAAAAVLAVVMTLWSVRRRERFQSREPLK